MLLLIILIIAFTAFISIWTIVFKSPHNSAITLCPVTKWSKCVIFSCFFIKHFFRNASPSFCVPKTKVPTQIKLEIKTEMFNSCNYAEYTDLHTLMELYYVNKEKLQIRVLRSVKELRIDVEIFTYIT